MDISVRLSLNLRGISVRIIDFCDQPDHGDPELSAGVSEVRKGLSSSMHEDEQIVPGETIQSKRDKLRQLAVGLEKVAKPGDVVFYITESGSHGIPGLLRKWYRSLQGYDWTDDTRWHTSIYTGLKAEGNGALKRPYIIHAVEAGVMESMLTPNYFISELSGSGEIIMKRRIEVMQFDIPDGKRQAIVSYAMRQKNKRYIELGWRYAALTYVFGLPTGKIDSRSVSCHGLVFRALQENADISPRHHDFSNAPLFNLARYLGYPLGHRKDRVNLDRLYLQDIDLYRHPAGFVVLDALNDDTIGTMRISLNPGKYSWRPDLKDKYGV